jgi:hypothetical protein
MKIYRKNWGRWLIGSLATFHKFKKNIMGMCGKINEKVGKPLEFL